MTLREAIIQRGLEIGFDLVSVAPVGELPHRAAFDRWLDDGLHGEMAYLHRRRALRIDPRGVLPSARSVVSLAQSYHQAEPGAIGTYARGLDYHDVFRERLRALATFVKEEAGPHVKTRWCIDSAPLNERDVAWLAGLGWFGRNTCLIHPRLGSFLLLAELCLSIDLSAPEYGGDAIPSTPAPNRCGTCSRCLDACPTAAFVEPYKLDARRCISYLTIELRGPIPHHLRQAVGERLFGCDVCQDVCPWNRKAPVCADPAFAPLDAVTALTPERLLAMSSAAFDQHFARSPLARPGRDGMARNACVALGNRGDVRAVPALSAALESDRSSLVRGHAAWALGVLGGPDADAALRRAQIGEDDPYVLEELELALGEHQP